MTRSGAALAALAAAAACFITCENLPVGLLPQISASLHSSLRATALLVTGYAIVVVLVSAPLTHLTRKVPRRTLLTGLLVTLALGSLASAAASAYGQMLAARVVTALAQALFWAVGPVTAATILRPEARGRAVGSVFAGSAIGIVLGVPACTWLGQRAGWSVPFDVLGGVGLLAAAASWAVLPATRPVDGHAAAGSAPDARRFRVIVLTTALVVSAFYASFTYISPFLTRVSGVAHGDVALVLLAGGLASTAGLMLGTALYGRRPVVAVIAPVVLVAIALTGLWVFGRAAVPAAAFQALDGLGLGGLTVAAQTGVLVYAPGSADIATAWFSASFNIGIAAGPLIGALALAVAGLRSTALAGALLASVAVAAALRFRAARG